MRFCEDPKFDKVELLLGLSRQFADNVNSDYEDFEKDAKNAAEFEIPGNRIEKENSKKITRKIFNPRKKPFLTSEISSTSLIPKSPISLFSQA